MDYQNEEFEIDLLDLFNYLKKRIAIIAAVTLVSTFLGFFATTFMMSPKYTATTRMYVLNRSSETHISSSDYSVSNYMVSDYEILITGKNVTSEVISQLGLDMSIAQLTGKIEVMAIEDTRILQINVVDTDPKRAADIANCVREVASVQIKEIMDVDAVNLVYEATVPEKKSGPSVSKNSLLAGALGCIGVMGCFVVVYLTDNTLRTEEDVERYLGLSTLGAIPIAKELDVGTNKRSRKKTFLGIPLPVAKKK